MAKNFEKLIFGGLHEKHVKAYLPRPITKRRHVMYEPDFVWQRPQLDCTDMDDGPVRKGLCGLI
jgi:hypothetical protein